MKLTDDFENENNIKSGVSLGGMIAGIMAFMIILVAVVLIANKPKGPGRSPLADNQDQRPEVVSVSVNDEADSEYPIGESTLVSDDLDFWNMYEVDVELDKSLDHTAERYAENLKEMEEEEKEEDLSQNGTKTEVIYPDGTSQWVMINAYIAKNSYDYTGLVYEEPYMRYYADGKKASRQGVKIDDSCGTVNFVQVEEDGIDYCIIRIGKRGYATGAISLDENYLTYMKEALGIGVSFYSQAVNEAEAIEEANLVVQALQQAEIKPEYPVIFDMELVNNDSSRTEKLTKNQLTAITKAFCNTISQNGYTPAVYGNKYWLLRKLDLTQLSGYNIWLSKEGDVPDYPYEFAMWEYKQDAKIDGIAGNVSLSISFIDYEMR